MFNNDLYSDVKFVVPQNADVESESKQVIPAHKFVLSISSPVFEAMFYGELAETRDSIELPDCEYESLLELLRYMYSDEVNLSGSNVMGVLYLAKKYVVPSLAEKCSEYLQDNLAPSNVFSILPSAQKFEEKSLVDRCWKVIDKETEEAVKSNIFVTIERSLLEEVVVRDTLTIKEIELFKAVDLWATKECGKQGLEADGDIKRRILGEHIIKRIRFPVMKPEEFAGVVLDSKLLVPEEVASIVKYQSSVLDCPVGFPETKRTAFCGEDFQRCRRFSALNFGWTNVGNSYLKLCVDKDIFLHGVYLFGSKDNVYTIHLTIKNAADVNVILSSVNDTFMPMLHNSAACYGFDVMLKSPLLLRKGVVYRIKAHIFGPQSWYGSRGESSVRFSDLTVSFQNSQKKNSVRGKTNVSQGQFYEFIFSQK